MRDFYSDLLNSVIGVDEVGRGALCGPVVSCALVLNPNILNYDLLKEIDDSKKLNENKRKVLNNFITQNSSFSIGLANNFEIDKFNILQATILSMQRALNRFKKCKNIIRIDGKKIFSSERPLKFLVGGDKKSVSIASASIVAKCYRDAYVKQFSKLHPHYGWDKNKGYGTKKHFKAIEKYGVTEFHRKTFLKKYLIKP